MIKCRHVSFQYDNKSTYVLKDVNLSVEVNDFIVIKGASGSGKTTLLNIIGMLIMPTEGELFYKESLVHVDQQTSLRRTDFCYIFQDFKLIREYTILENLLLVLYLNDGVPSSERLQKIYGFLEVVGLSKTYLNKLPSELSGGERQRVGFVRALLCGGKIVVADEITGSLDTLSAQVIMTYLEALNQRGYTIIMTTHDERFFTSGKRLICVEDSGVHEVF